MTANLTCGGEFHVYVREKVFQVMRRIEDGGSSSAGAHQRRRLAEEVGLDHRTQQVERASLPHASDRLVCGCVAMEVATECIRHQLRHVVRGVNVRKLEVVDHEHEVGRVPALDLSHHGMHELVDQRARRGRRGIA
ncbi:MAG TPA: hypothetical protein VHT91_02195 [Kofleriaceae bacterium]|jgi:hypothetical protein|nr:hypothetical protein [Kofleriaceae bacterium]